MSIVHRTFPLSRDERVMLALVEELRRKELLGDGNLWGSPDELLELSGGPTSELAEFSLLMGPPTMRAVARQPRRDMLPAGDLDGGSPLSGKPQLGPDPAPLRLEIEHWNGSGWQYSASHIGTNLGAALRTLESCTFPLDDDIGQLKKLPALPGNFAGALAYDLVQWTQPWRLRHPPEEDAILAILWRVDRWLIHDRAAETLHLLTMSGDEWGDEVAAMLAAKPTLEITDSGSAPKVEGEVSSHTDQQHAEIVRQVQKAITAGQLYQLNFGRTWSGELAEHPWQVMLRLAGDNPAPFSAWLNCPDLQVALCSSSPELLLSSSEGFLVTRPIKGTRPRGGTAESELRLRQELLNDEKELAEHHMLVDLERNDIALVSKAGSVEQSHYQVEAYAQVQHLVSEVRGEIREEADVWSALQAMFPGGSITGCPKTVTCAAIDLLERKPRSFWSGSIGHIDARCGRSAWNILIRTLEAREDQNGWQAVVQAGGGLVIGSNPKAEVEEAKWKAAALRRAAGWLAPDSHSELPSGEIAIFPQPLRKQPLMMTSGIGTVSRWPLSSGDKVTGKGRARILFIDNLDSFAWNIIHACAGLGAHVIHVCGLSTAIEELDNIIRATAATHIIIGPGPGRPSNSKLSERVAELALAGNLLDCDAIKIPVLGICLGHQAIGIAAGLELVESPLGAVHGVAVEIHHDGSGIFSSLPNPVAMVRYNSLVIQPGESELEITAWDDSGTLPMAFSHPLHPLQSLQFHPESCGSELGSKLLSAFISTSPGLQPWLAHG